tara:strand:+ start:228 stop:776 length:549 start_codon:yes stop_codon:yes gene_type:complete
MNSLDKKILKVKEKLNEINKMALKRGFNHQTRNHLLFEIGEEVDFPKKEKWSLGSDARINSYDIVDRFGYDVFLTCESWNLGQIITLVGIYDLKEIKESDFFKGKYNHKYNTVYEGNIKSLSQKEYMVWMSNRTYKPFEIKLGVSSNDAAGWGGKGAVYIYHYKNKMKFLNWNDLEPWEVKP